MGFCSNNNNNYNNNKTVNVQNKKLAADSHNTEGYVTEEDEGADTEKSRKNNKRVS